MHRTLTAVVFLSTVFGQEPKSGPALPHKLVTNWAQLPKGWNFGETSGVVVDVCSSHGVWFDRGELGTILEYCASGELKKAEAGALERREARQQLDRFQRRLDTAGPEHYYSVGNTTMSQETLEQLCLELAGMLGLDKD